jgi:hypothetical protein
LNTRLRRNHLRIVVSLAAFLLAALSAAWGAYAPPPRASSPAALRSPVSEAVEVWRSETLFGALPIQMRLLRSSERWLIELEPRQDPLQPDVLVYWGPEFPRASDGLPRAAHFLGRLAGTQVRRFALPSGANPDGMLFLYSLGHQQVLDRALVRAEAPGS